MQRCSGEAWNNFVLRSGLPLPEGSQQYRAATIAALFMGLANNGGLNSFLTSSYELDAQEVVDALKAVGAGNAARQLEEVMQGLATSLPPMPQEERWGLLDRNWTDELDELDVLSREADTELVIALQRHVSRNEAYYLRAN